MIHLQIIETVLCVLTLVHGACSLHNIYLYQNIIVDLDFIDVDHIIILVLEVLDEDPLRELQFIEVDPFVAAQVVDQLGERDGFLVDLLMQILQRGPSGLW